MSSLDELPLRPELRGRTPYGAPQLPAKYRTLAIAQLKTLVIAP